jgi:hypothetical protein
VAVECVEPPERALFVHFYGFAVMDKPEKGSSIVVAGGEKSTKKPILLPSLLSSGPSTPPP